MAADYGMENFIVKLFHHNRNNIKNKLRNLQSRYTHQNDGFTLLEMIVVILMVGILSGIAAPGWLAFVNRQRLNKSYDGVVSALQQAQTSAKKSKLSYNASFRVNSTTNIPEYIVYQGAIGTLPPSSGWNSLGSDLQQAKVLLYTNLSSTPTSTTVSNPANAITNSGNIVLTTTGSGTITFDYMGALAQKSDGTDADTPLKVMVAIPNSGTTQAGNSRRCAIVESLIGGMRTAKDTNCT